MPFLRRGAKGANLQRCSGNLLSIEHIHAKVDERCLKKDNALMEGAGPSVEVHKDALSDFVSGDFKTRNVRRVDFQNVLLDLHLLLVLGDFLYLDVRDISNERDGFGLKQVPTLHKIDELELDGLEGSCSDELNRKVQFQVNGSWSVYDVPVNALLTHRGKLGQLDGS